MREECSATHPSVPAESDLDRPTLAAWRGARQDAAILVCGCGPSLNALPTKPDCLTIGVNDVGRRFDPDYLVVVNPASQFPPDRLRAITQSRARAVFSQYPDLPLAHAPLVRIRLGQYNGTDFADPEVLHHTQNSPYVAIWLAIHMGARRVGLIGVDFTDDHFFGATGRHPLSGRLGQIDREYAALAEACRVKGVELVNLSPTSRLTSLPRASLGAWITASGMTERSAAESPTPRRVFCVHYRFLSCGTVFETGLREAAQTLGLTSEHAYWDDAQLPEKVRQFQPDLLFVVHGRRFVQRWRDGFRSWRSAVWLLDEPYEVDDTASWSGHFDHVFVNDPASLARHRTAHVLPVAYAPALHHDPGAGERRYRTGFIGGANPSRERLLSGLAGRGLLDYVVGGPWSDTRLRMLTLAENVPAERTAALYRDSQIVLNVFRDRHHYNRAGLAATTMNPRICEALACGALVISEPREALSREVPELPTFSSEAEAAALIEHFLAHPNDLRRTRDACATRLRDATYRQRLKVVMDTALAAASFGDGERPATRDAAANRPLPSIEPRPQPPGDQVVPFDADWDDVGGVVRTDDANEIVIDPGSFRGPGAERGLASRARFGSVDLMFEARLEPGACLIAKVHQTDQVDQMTNSYHVLADERRAYLARHAHVFQRFQSPGMTWVRLRLVCRNGTLSLWRDGQLLHRVHDRELSGGFAFVGAQGGRARVRQLRLWAGDDAGEGIGGDTERSPVRDDADELHAVAAGPPRLSIVTTVYDRIECLRQCISSVRRLTFQDYEHLIVADHPSPEVLQRIGSVIADAGDQRIGLFNLRRRHNNWGIAPAAAGLRRARGTYLSFLSDDNGYTTDHADALVGELDRDPAIGFVYSSCQYDGRLVLRHPIPRPGRIDLGQLMFRRQLFELHFANDLPFDVIAWDWHMVDALIRRGVRWRHIDRLSFVFRLAKYPHLAAA